MELGDAPCMAIQRSFESRLSVPRNTRQLSRPTTGRSGRIGVRFFVGSLIFGDAL